MKAFKLFPLCSLLVLATPIASFAQMKNSTYASGSESQITKVSKGKETIKQDIKKFSISDGDTSIQTISLSMSGKNIEGAMNEMMMQSFEQMESQGDAAMKQLRVGMSEDTNLGGMLSTEFTGADEDGFTMTTTMSMNDQEAEMYTETEENTNVLRVDNYTTTTTTDAFSNDAGFIVTFDN